MDGFEASKAKYFSLVAESSIPKLDRNYYQGIIKVLLENETKQENRKSIPPNLILRQYQEEYELLFDSDGRHYLIKKRGSPNDPVIEYIPLEDSFDVLHRTHVWNSHAGQNSMRRLVKKKYVLNHLFIDLYLQCCSVCNNRQAQLETIIKYDPEVFFKPCETEITAEIKPEVTFETEPEITVHNELEITKNIDQTVDIDEFPQNSRTQPEKIPKCRLTKAVLLDTIELPTDPDGSFKVVFIYFHRDTSFILLRPLMTKNPFEVAMETLKIITSFGAPNYFIIAPNQRAFYESVLENLSMLGLTCKIPLREKLKKTRINIQYTYLQYIKENLEQWMKESGSRNWGVGCHLLQSRLNNSKGNYKTNEEFCLDSEETSHSQVFRTERNNLPMRNYDGSDSDETKETDSKKAHTGLTKKARRKRSSQYYSNVECHLKKKKGLNDTSTMNFVVSNVNMIPQLVAVESNNICHICNIKMSDRFITCGMCHKTVHLFCSESSNGSNSSHTCYRCGELIRM